MGWSCSTFIKNTYITLLTTLNRSLGCWITIRISSDSSDTPRLLRLMQLEIPCVLLCSSCMRLQFLHTMQLQYLFLGESTHVIVVRIRLSLCNARRLVSDRKNQCHAIQCSCTPTSEGGIRLLVRWNFQKHWVGMCEITEVQQQRNCYNRQHLADGGRHGVVLRHLVFILLLTNLQVVSIDFKLSKKLQ